MGAAEGDVPNLGLVARDPLWWDALPVLFSHGSRLETICRPLVPDAGVQTCRYAAFETLFE